MADVIAGTCSMFGAFNLREGGDQTTFRAAFDAFCAHLQDVGHVVSWRLMERAYHEGYDSGFPDLHVLIEMVFPTYEASLSAWSYIEEGSQPMKGLHHRMITQIEDARFVLFHQR